MNLKLFLNIVLLLSQTVLASGAEKIATNDMEFCEIMEKYSEEYLEMSPREGDIYGYHSLMIEPHSRPNSDSSRRYEAIIPFFLQIQVKDCLKLNENFLINSLNAIDKHVIKNVHDYIEGLHLNILNLKIHLRMHLEGIYTKTLKAGGLTEAEKPNVLIHMAKLREEWKYKLESFSDYLIPIKSSAQIIRVNLEVLQSKNQEFITQKTDKKLIDRLIEISDRLANFDEGELEYQNAINALLEGEMMINEFYEELFNS